jgi:hypothetical protein
VVARFIKRPTLAKLAALSVSIAAVLLTSSCAWRTKIPVDPMAADAGDRCYIENEQFVHADRLYSQMGSLDLVARYLREQDQWRKCEVNEAIYRLRKVHDLP